MLSRLLIMDALDDGSRIVAVGINYNIGACYDAGTTYIGDGPGASNLVYVLDSNLALTISKSLTFGVGGNYSCDGLVVNGSTLFLAGFENNSVSDNPAAVGFDKATVTTVGLDRYFSFSTHRFRAASVDSGTGVYCVGESAADKLICASFSAAGALNWGAQLVDVANYLSAASAYDVALNPNNSNFTAGGSITRTSDGDVRGLVVAFNSSGTFQWGFELYGTGSNRVAGLCCDASGNTYVALGGSGGAVPLIAKLDSSGSVTASLNLDTSQVTDLHGIYLQGTVLIVAGTHASGGLALVLTDTSLSTPTGARLYDTAGAMPYPRAVRFGYSGGFYYFNFAANGGNACIAKLTPDVLAAPVATFGNRFQLEAFTPSSAAYTLNSAATGANYTTSSSTTTTGFVTGTTAAASPSLTDYFAS